MQTPIYVITLEQEPWKRKIAQEHFDAFGLSVRWVPGFHGETLHLAPLLANDYHPNGERTYVHLTQLGHTLSYLAALRIGIVNDDSEFLICEDDVMFEPDFHDRWPKLWDAMVDLADVVQLEYCRSDDKPYLEINSELANCYYPFGNAANWWTKTAAEFAIRAMRPICEPTDIALMRRVYPFLRHAVCHPPLATQRTAYGHWPSAIGSEHKPI